jgi:hypothetical protein
MHIAVRDQAVETKMISVSIWTESRFDFGRNAICLKTYYGVRAGSSEAIRELEI